MPEDAGCVHIGTEHVHLCAFSEAIGECLLYHTGHVTISCGAEGIRVTEPAKYNSEVPFVCSGMYVVSPLVIMYRNKVVYICSLQSLLRV